MCEMSRAPATLSNPNCCPSSGSSSFTCSSGSARRSRKACSYSVRFIRRTVVRPPPALSAIVSAAVRSFPSAARKAVRPNSGGRSFFFGGISPSGTAAGGVCFSAILPDARSQLSHPRTRKTAARPEARGIHSTEPSASSASDPAHSQSSPAKMPLRPRPAGS